MEHTRRPDADWPFWLYASSGAFGTALGILGGLLLATGPAGPAAVCAPTMALLAAALRGRVVGLPAAVGGSFAFAATHLVDQHGVLRPTNDSRSFFLVLALAIVAAVAGDRWWLRSRPVATSASG